MRKVIALMGIDASSYTLSSKKKLGNLTTLTFWKKVFSKLKAGLSPKVSLRLKIFWWIHSRLIVSKFLRK